MPTSIAGFSFVWMLAAVAILSWGLASAAEKWSDVARREREAELIRIGTLYAVAIKSYYDRAPGSARRYPPELSNLLEDDRTIGTTRHIRKLYADPVGLSRAWGIERAADGGVSGVFSRSEDQPLRAVRIDIGVGVLPVATRYSDWKFSPVIKP